MKKHVAIFLFGSLLSYNTQANDPVVMKVDGKEVLKSEFEYLYKKNNTGIALDEYVELFKNFKLKVAEAQAQGIDTTAAFVKELKENRTQLAKQYLKEPSVDESLLLKEYERLKEDIEISHVAIPVKLEFIDGAEGERDTILSPQLLPADTVAAYNQAMQYRKRLLKGEKIEKIAKEIEKSFRMPNNPPTYMGWASAMMMIPSIEDAIYSTPAKSVSMPVRFNSLYLLFQVLDKRQSMGEINASHIMVACPPDADTIQVDDARKKAEEIYKRVISGEDFATVAKELSDDKGSGQQGGELGWFGSGRMVKEFENAAFALKNKGDISLPAKSQFGFHIIRLNDTRSIEPFEQKKGQITNFLSRGDNSFELRKPGIDSLKQSSNFTENEQAYQALMALANQLFPSDPSFQSDDQLSGEILFTVWDKPYKVSDFLAFMSKSRSNYILSTDIVADQYQTFVLEVLKKEEDAHLEKQYDDFRNLMKEYHDGFLSYEVTQKEVWEKAPKDTVGLTNFFLENKDKYNWESPRYKGVVVFCKDAKTKKQAQKSIKKRPVEEIAQLLTTEFNNDSIKLVKVERGLFAQGNNAQVDQVIFKSGKAEEKKDFPEFFVVGKLLKNGPESYTDVGGLVISDYQNYLEQEWLKQLRTKYPIEIDTEVLNTIE